MTLFRFRYRLVGIHVRIAVWAGKGNSSLGKCGDLVMRPEEWQDFLAELARRPPGGSIEVIDDNAGVQDCPSCGSSDFERIGDREICATCGR
jgi:hypothetical protein